MEKNGNDDSTPKSNKWFYIGIASSLIFVLIVVLIVFSLLPQPQQQPKFKKIKIYHGQTKEECLHFSEIEILNDKNEKVNISKDKIIMSSIYTAEGNTKFSTDKIVDDNNFTSAHTECGKGESITITFDDFTTISKITIKNRYGENQDRFKDVYIALFNNDEQTPLDKYNIQIKEIYQIYVIKLEDDKLVIKDDLCTKVR